MNNKFYNYLYDYLISKDLMKDKHPKDQKEKMEFAKDYIQRLMKLHDVYSNRDSDMLKNMYLNRYVIKYENIPDSYWKTQERMYLERGMGHHTMSDSEKRQLSDIIIKDQTKSLENILDYFFSEDARFYPDDLKFWAFQGLLQLGTYHKDTNLFDKRTKSTVAPFIDINREALALSINEMNNFINNGNASNKDLLEEIFNSNLNKSFSTLYTFYLKQVDTNRKSKIVSDDGIWIKYNQGTDHMKLVKTLEGKGTGWCTAGESMAKSQLKNGDFYVYYTKGETDEYTEPRIAIRMDGTNKIGEIRGIAENQNIEPNMEQVLDKKLEEFPDKDKYKKKVSDMEKLTIIYNKYKKEEELSNEELRFLYEIDNQIEGFGYEKDPRIKEIIDTRDMKEDLSKVFNCSKEEIGIEPEKLGDIPLKYYYGSLNLSRLTSADGLTLPAIVGGGLVLRGLTSAEGLTLPNSVGRNLDLSSLISAEGLTLPNYVGRNLYLSSLISAEGLTLPNYVGGSLYLGRLTSADGLILPNYVGRSLDLSRLTSAEGLTLPNSVSGDLSLRNLTSAEGLTLPKSVNGSLYLDSITSAVGLTLPSSIGGTLFLRSLTDLDSLVFPPNFQCHYIYLGKLGFEGSYEKFKIFMNNNKNKKR